MIQYTVRFWKVNMACKAETIVGNTCARIDCQGQSCKTRARRQKYCTRQCYSLARDATAIVVFFSLPSVFLDEIRFGLIFLRWNRVRWIQIIYSRHFQSDIRLGKYFFLDVFEKFPDSRLWSWISRNFRNFNGAFRLFYLAAMMAVHLSHLREFSPPYFSKEINFSFQKCKNVTAPLQDDVCAQVQVSGSHYSLLHTTVLDSRFSRKYCRL